eukprot:Hpha_TRINITY_DN11105_c1_g1::TRINITY_DN11105_c1_g1_i1::g.27915::m.27915/K19372/DNAJC27; DnaJ homolog subfamily C member 27
MWAGGGPDEAQRNRRASFVSSLTDPVVQKLRRLPKPHCLRVKIISIGAEKAGKSCLIKRYCEERFVTRYITTIGIDFGVKKVRVGDDEVKVNFWDLSGSKPFFEIRNEFYADAEGALVVYDVTNRKSFTDLEEWLREARRFGCRPGIPMALCANKQDLVAAGVGQRQVTDEEGRSFAQAHGMHYWATSANTGEGVLEMFNWLFADTVDFAALR